MEKGALLLFPINFSSVLVPSLLKHPSLLLGSLTSVLKLHPWWQGLHSWHLSAKKYMLILTIKFCASARVTLVLVSTLKNPQPIQNTITRDNSVPAFLKIKQAVWYVWIFFVNFVINTVICGNSVTLPWLMMLFRYNKYRSPLGLFNYMISHEIGTDNRVHPCTGRKYSTWNKKCIDFSNLIKTPAQESIARSLFNIMHWMIMNIFYHYVGLMSQLQELSISTSYTAF